MILSLSSLVICLCAGSAAAAARGGSVDEALDELSVIEVLEFKRQSYNNEKEKTDGDYENDLVINDTNRFEARQDDPTNTTPEPSDTTTTSSAAANGGENDNTLAIALGVSIPLLLILAGVMCWICRNRKHPRIRLAIRVSTRRRKRRLSYHPITLEEFNSQYSSRKVHGEIEVEFDLLQEHSNLIYESKPRQIGLHEINKAKNRFVDIIPYDETLVQLQKESGTPPSTYINASFIEGTSRGERHIATQGPKRNTVVDFWNMILEQEVAVVVCLTNPVEAGRVKCFQYWPNMGEMLHFDELVLETKDEQVTHNGECIIRKIEVSKEDDDAGDEPPPIKIITQFHLTSWPDHGVPASSRPLLNLCESLANMTGGGSCPPMVVHCSAGVGRTGTLLATLFIMQEISQKKAKEVDVTMVVKRMREQRPKMVQTFDQYSFIYTCIRDYINGLKFTAGDGKSADSHSRGSTTSTSTFQPTEQSPE